MTALPALLLSLTLPQTTPPPPSPVPATHLKTRWAADVRADRVLPEYPRPQMVRRDWQNLNGEWSYALTTVDAPRPATFDRRILVPFPIESQLSGAGVWVSPDQRLWYRRTFTAPRLPAGHRLLLHFGAVDWEASVSVNGRAVGDHRGGFDPFTIDLTDALRPNGAEQELVVSVRDPTNTGQQPRGKQVLRPRSIFYTAVTGIWQTVWIEPVPAAHITDIRIDPDLNRGQVQVTVSAVGGDARATATVLDGDREVASATGGVASAMTIALPNAHRWSPRDPFLYSLRVRLDSGDSIDSYFGMRSIAVRTDAAGVPRLFLNGEPLFMFGPLDQGWWPDGLYTAPTDEALASDITATRDLGFNVIRKHVKVEPDRWYYHCDRLGMLVWQDMPSGDNKGADAEADFARELQALVDARRNHPSIVMWVPFNEGWGQHATEKYVSWLKSYDPTRLVNNASGWSDTGVGDVRDLHSYPGPGIPPLEGTRAAVLGEFGGLGLPLPDHTWIGQGNWGYRSYTTLEDLNVAYRRLVDELRLDEADGLAAAIYTQTTDCEIEVNGVMTYDRGVVKLSADSIAANRRLFDPLPAIRHVAPASDRAPQTWRYTLSAPPPQWFAPSFDDSAWTSGAGGFGAPDTRHARVGTSWKTDDIWLRRAFNLSAVPAHPYLRIFHDDDAEVYVNGERIAEFPGANNSYAYVPLTAAGHAALHAGANTLAVHAHQTRGGQFIDAGIVDVAETQTPAAPPAAVPAAQPPVISPEVQSDRRVTFRIRAPNAKEAFVTLEGMPRLPMLKDDRGVWSATTQPLEPDFYGYSIVVDGARLLDSPNPLIKTNLQNPASLVHVPGDRSLPWEVRDVPHGTVHHQYYRSAVAGDDRDFFVYTPPNYSASTSTRYPVLYLLHGMSDGADAWSSEVGRANVILDNLIADGKARPMIVVMPLGYGAPEILRPTPPGATRDPGLSKRNRDVFRQTLVGEVMPLVERDYRVLSNPNNRAIAGLSMGGGESLLAGLTAPLAFGWVGAFSSAVPPDPAAEFPALDAAGANAQLKLLWIACGTEDRLIDPNRRFRAWLDSRHVRHVDVETPGAHVWMVWRRNLAAFAPLLFR